MINKKIVILAISLVLATEANASAASLNSHKWKSANLGSNSIVSTVVKNSAMSRQQAIASAKEYLASQAFSRKGLIDQLKYEGFSTKDATYAVDHIKVNWQIQAYKSAKEYLRSQSFSKKGLYSQLIYEGFTASQAGYGVNRAYR